MMEWIYPVLRTWMHIAFGLGVFTTALAFAWCIWCYITKRLDLKDIEHERWERIMRESRGEINRYRGERYYRDADEREPHGN